MEYKIELINMDLDDYYTNDLEKENNIMETIYEIDENTISNLIYREKNIYGMMIDFIIDQIDSIKQPNVK